MIVGIVLFAFAMKTIVPHVGDELDSAAAFALCGGYSLYLLTYSTIRSASIAGSAGVGCCRSRVPARPAARDEDLGARRARVVTIIWLGLHAYELVWWREARAESRSMIASS
jgi:hypothetical protein